MALLEALQSSWIKISTAVPQLVIRMLPASATSCCRCPSSGGCAIHSTPLRLALPPPPPPPPCLGVWFRPSSLHPSVFIPVSSLHFPATTFSTKLMSRERGVGLPVNRMKLHKGSDAVRMGDVRLLLRSSPLDTGLVASDSPALGLLSRGSRAGTALYGLLWR